MGVPILSMDFYFTVQTIYSSNDIREMSPNFVKLRSKEWELWGVRPAYKFVDIFD